MVHLIHAVPAGDGAIASSATGATSPARWTQSALTELRRSLREGQPVVEIAGRLGRAPVEVQAMMARLRLKEV